MTNKFENYCTCNEVSLPMPSGSDVSLFSCKSKTFWINTFVFLIVNMYHLSHNNNIGLKEIISTAIDST